ncbi:MAG: UTP--glucose-1-phosphate uridylyltransferase GalU [Desulfovibrionaceae bacterium]
MDVRKVVIPVAGWGTRSLPASKNVPKEMLPVFNKPVVQYVVEEAMQSGITDVILITNQSKRIIEDHFDHNFLLEAQLERAGKTKILEEVRYVAEMVNIIAVRQKQQLGLGHAVLCARDVVHDEPFAIMVGDDLMFGMEPGIGQLIEVFKETGKSVIGVMDVPPDKVNRYGIIKGREVASGLYELDDMVEKPPVGQAPSTLAITGRYVLTPEIFAILKQQKPGHGGEIQLTDAMQTLLKQQGMMAVKIRGQRFDAGDWAEYLTANIYFALQDEDLRDELVRKLKVLLPNTAD